jgi:4-amino-4-deoxy-L-arabinose transferase-like glycosyltransferase
MSDARKDWWIAALLFVGSALVRLPYRTEHIFHGDSYGLACGVLFTLTAHPPGFIGYCTLVRLVYLIAGDLQTAFMIVGIVTTALATSLTYCLGTQMFDRRAGLVAALLYATSLDSSYFATTALSYSSEGAFATAAALAAWMSVKRRSFPWLLAFAVVLALGGSVRQTTLAFLFPLFLWVTWRSVPRSWQRIAALLVLAVTVSLWSGQNAKRLARYWDQADIGYLQSVYRLQVAMEQYYDSSTFGAVTYERAAPRFHWPLVELGVGLWNRISPPAADAPLEVRTASVGNAARMLRYQTAKVLLYGVLALGMATPFVLLALLRRVRVSFGAERWLFLGLWILPAALFFAFNHFGAWGYLLIFLAGLVTIAARSITILFERKWLLATVLVAGVNASAFVFLRPLPEVTERNRLLNIAVLQYNGPALRQHFARARSSAFNPDPRQLRLGCFSTPCLERSIPNDFGLPPDLRPVRPLADR